MAMGGGLGSLLPYQQASQPSRGKGSPMNQTQPMPLYPERPPNPFADQFDLFPARPPNPFADQFDSVGADNTKPKGMRFGDQFTDFMNSPEYKGVADNAGAFGGVETADMRRSDIFTDYLGSSSRIAPYEKAYRDYEARLNAPDTSAQPAVVTGETDFFRNAPRTDLPFEPARPGTPDYNKELQKEYINALTMDPNYGRRPQIPRFPFMQPQPFYGGLGGFLGGGYGFPMGGMYGGFRNRFGGFPMGMTPYQQPVMGKGFSPFRPIQPQTKPTMGKGPSDEPLVPTQEEMTPLLDEFTDFYLNDYRPRMTNQNASTTASPYGSTLANQNLFGIGRLLSGMR